MNSDPKSHVPPADKGKAMVRQPPYFRRPESLIAFLVLLGLTGYAVCLARHFCQCGHMAHPPYEWWDYALDVGWASLFSAAGVTGIIWRPVSGVLWAVLLGALAVSRFAFAHTMGLSIFCLELPTSAALLVRSIVLLVPPARTSAKPSVTDQ